MIGVDVRWRHSNCHNYAIKNLNGVAGNNFATRSCQRDIGNKIDCSVRAVCIKFQRRISREGAAADIEHTVCAKRAHFEHICVNAGIIECDRSSSVDEGRERPAGIITAAVDIDGRGCAPSLPEIAMVASLVKGLLPETSC